MRWAVCALALLGPVGLAGSAWGAATEAPAPAAPEVIVDPGGTPPAALDAIMQAVQAITRLADDRDGGEANRLRRRAREAALAALATQGYFSAKVTLTPGTDVGGETWDLAIEPGPRAEVESVELRFTGRIARPEYAERIATLRKGWALPKGKPFINADWNKAKSDLLQAVMDRDFLLARMTSSAAQVDAERARVRLSVVIDSGPRVRMGTLRMEGLERVPPRLIRRYVSYRPGDAYDQDRLDAWQQELQSTAFFRGAFVSMDTASLRGAAAAGPARSDDPGAQAPSGDAAVSGGPATAAAAAAPRPDSDGDVTLPVEVRVVEAPPKRAAASIGVDDEVGARLEATYRQNVVLGHPVTMETGFGVDRQRQRAYLDFNLPPDARGRKDSIGLLADHSDIQGLDVTRFAIGATRLQERKGAGDSRVEYETRWGGLLAHDRVRIEDGDSYDLPTATLTAEWLRRDVDSKYDPREGNLIAVGGGVGVALDNGEPYTRVRLRGQKWWPVGRRDVLTVRAEVGRIWSDSRTRVPDDFGFRTGGARSIRGYRYQSIGERRDGAVVGAATLAVGSIEYDHYFNERWGVGAFVDAGDAAASFGSMDVALGYGLGARVRTPAGPLFLDVAYGQRERDLRLHFSLGIAF